MYRLHSLLPNYELGYTKQICQFASFNRLRFRVSLTSHFINFIPILKYLYLIFLNKIISTFEVVFVEIVSESDFSSVMITEVIELGSGVEHQFSFASCFVGKTTAKASLT